MFQTNVVEKKIHISFFDILLTMHLSIILVINQLNAQIYALSWLITKITNTGFYRESNILRVKYSKTLSN